MDPLFVGMIIIILSVIIIILSALLVWLLNSETNNKCIQKKVNCAKIENVEIKNHNHIAAAQFGYIYEVNSPFQTIEPNGFFGYPNIITNYGNAVMQINPFTYRVNIKGVYLITVNECYIHDEHSLSNQIGVAINGIITNTNGTIGSHANINYRPVTGTYLVTLPINQTINIVNPYNKLINKTRSHDFDSLLTFILLTPL